MIKIKIVDFLKDMFGSKTEITLKEEIHTTTMQICVEDFAAQMAINMIAGAIAKCEFKTFCKNKPIKKDDYYKLNVEPNCSQNADEFWREAVSKLLYSNECLVVPVSNSFYIADSYSRTFNQLGKESVFSDVVCGNLQIYQKYTDKEVLFFKLNNQDIRALLDQIAEQYENLLQLAVNKYKRSGGRKGIMYLHKLPSGKIEDIEKMANFVKKQMYPYFNEENAVANLPEGMKYEEISGDGSKKSTSDVKDISDLLQEAIALVARALQIPPALLQGNIADIDSLLNEFLTFCIDPICRLIETEINRKMYGKAAYLSGSCVRIDTTCIKHIDIFSIAEQADKLIASGIYSIDDIREKIGDTPINTWWSQKHWITKNYEEIENSDMKGGE